MEQVMTMIGVPFVVLLSFLFALGIEVLLLTCAFGLMMRSARTMARKAAAPLDKSSAH